MGGRLYFVYITTNKWRSVLYTGMTNDIVRRGHEHRDKVNAGSFTARYNCHILVYYEVFDDPSDAIAREKQIKAGSRAKKIALIEAKTRSGAICCRRLNERNGPGRGPAALGRVMARTPARRSREGGRSHPLTGSFV